MKIFVCPRCKSPHFGSYEAKPERIYHCNGNEWNDIDSCGWEGVAEKCFLDKTIEEIAQYNRGWNKHVL